MMFDSGAGPAEQAYSNELGQPEPTYQRPVKATGAKKVAGKIMEFFPGLRHYSDPMLYGNVPEAREDYGLAVGTRERHLGNLKGGAELEAKRRNAANTAMYRSADLNVRFARNKREEDLLPSRMRVLESQIGRNRSMAGASSALEAQRRNPSAKRAPFRPFSPGQGIFSGETGKVSQQPNPAAMRAARPAGSSGGPTASQLSLVEKDKARDLLTHKGARDKRQLAIDTDNAGMSPTFPDGSPNPMYTRDYDLAELDKWDRGQKQMIQKSYEERLRRFGQSVEPYQYPEDGEEEDQGGDSAGFTEPDEADAMGADAMDQGDEAAAAGAEEDDTDFVMVEAPDGRRGTIPRGNLPKALQRGYKQVSE